MERRKSNKVLQRDLRERGSAEKRKRGWEIQIETKDKDED